MTNRTELYSRLSKDMEEKKLESGNVGIYKYNRTICGSNIYRVAFESYRDYLIELFGGSRIEAFYRLGEYYLRGRSKVERFPQKFELFVECKNREEHKCVLDYDIVTDVPQKIKIEEAIQEYREFKRNVPILRHYLPRISSDLAGLIEDMTCTYRRWFNIVMWELKSQTMGITSDFKKGYRRVWKEAVEKREDLYQWEKRRRRNLSPN